MLHVFPDTNVLLHYKRLDQLDWLSLSGASSVTLVLVPAVVGAIDRYKTGDSRRLRRRAQDLAAWLNSALEDAREIVPACGWRPP